MTKAEKAAYDRVYYQRRKDERTAQMRAWYALNRERKLATEATPEAADARKTRRLARIEECRALERESKRREYARRGPEILERAKAWQRAHRDYYRALQRLPRHRVHSNVSRAIRAAIKAEKAGRQWEILVGYSVADLMAHLERHFTAGMTWDNYGQWEIDHIRPKASFAFTSVEDDGFRACWALENLQPLWMRDNRKKHAKVGEAA